jgi:chromosome segregation ATPase
VPESPKTRHRLKSLVLSEVSLVDRPANPRATVVLFKRDSKEPSMTDAEKKLKDLEAELAKRDADAKKLSDEVAFLKSSFETTTAKLADVEKERDALKAKIKPEEPVAKLSPEVQAQIDAALKKAADTEAEILKIRDEQDTATFIAKAEAFKSLPQDPATFGPVLKRIARNKSTADDVIALETVLRSAAALLEKAPALNGSGSNRSATGSAEQKLEQLAKEYGEANKVDFAKAFDIVTQQNPSMYRQYLEETRAD